MEIIFFIPAFILAAFLAFYIPGRVVLGDQKNLSKLGLFAVSIILGIVLWGWQGYFLGFLQLRFLSYLYLLFFLGLFIKRKYFIFKIPSIQFRSFDWFTILMAVVGIIAQIIPFIRNGQVLQQGLFVSNNNTVDHVWRVTLVGELVRRFPPNEPGMYGVPLLNYHFWSPSRTLSLSYEYISPVEYKLDVKNTHKGDIIVFAENFDPHWIANTVSGIRYQVFSTKYQGRFNSFVLPQDGNYV